MEIIQSKFMVEYKKIKHIKRRNKMSTFLKNNSKKFDRLKAASKLRVTIGLILCAIVVFFPLFAYICGQSAAEKLKMNYIHEINISTENVIIQIDLFIKDGEFIWNDALNEGYSQIQQQQVSENLTAAAVQNRKSDLMNKIAEQQEQFNEKLYGKKASHRTQYEILRFEDRDVLSNISLYILWGSHSILLVVYLIWYYVMLGGSGIQEKRKERFHPVRYGLITSALMAVSIIAAYLLSGFILNLLIFSIVDVVFCAACSFIVFGYGKPV
jgi:uncharacterized membrane protein